MRDLHELARLHGVQTSYRDIIAGRARRVSTPALLAVLRALGAPVERMADAAGALRARREEAWSEGVEPVGVAWHGRPASLPIRVTGPAPATAKATLRLEDGGTIAWTVRPSRLPLLERVRLEGLPRARRRLHLPDGLPEGYHDLTLEMRGRRHACRVIVAPHRAFVSPGGKARRWGVFLPLYALRTERSPHAGDLTDLETLVRWVQGLGGGIVATLPLLAAFLDSPFNPSPYSPCSRLFWNEFYLDPTRLPDLERSPEARALLDGTPPDDGAWVDYRGVMDRKRRVLQALADAHAAAGGRGEAGFGRHLEKRPDLDDYARFRAVCDRRRESWRVWPASLRDGRVTPADYDERDRRYHLYAQWRTEQQIAGVAEIAARGGPGLYLDFPLGVHPDGYDVWRHRGAFALAASAGAPPDPFFTQGQDWGSPPLHPERIREEGYRYVIACFRHHMRHAGIVRIDHVMSLHRLFWVPAGFPAKAGVYVRYRAEELYAILTLESGRNRTELVGEDLGTVPRDVRPAMARHRIRTMHVLQYEVAPRARAALRSPPAGCLAAVNTHDMPPFAAFWRGLDIRDRKALGLLDAEDVPRERARREKTLRALMSWLARRGWLKRGESSPGAVLHACLAWLGAGPAGTVVVNLEDLWGETRPQNTPGTHEERPNWRGRARYTLESVGRMRSVMSSLRAVDRHRNDGESP